MYLSGEDFYLFCYSIFILLDTLGCSDGKVFKDYRKLAFLISILNDDKLVYILSNSGNENLNPVDRELLFDSYSNGLMKRSEILKLIFTLEKKGFVELEKGTEKSVLNITLNKTAIPESFFNSQVFENEYIRAKKLKKLVSRLNTLKFETMLEKIYSVNGVKTWAI